MAASGKLYLIPTVLDAQGFDSIPPYTIDAILDCQAFFVENERTARRYIRELWKHHPEENRTFVIDDHQWFTIHKAEGEVVSTFVALLKDGKNIGIISEAGCPAIADPGQVLVAAAQKLGVVVSPLVGPSSILLALMASGLNGQSFRFNGYLPIDNHERVKAIRELEQESSRKQCTEIFIETPYRNNQLLESLVKTCKASTRLTVAADLTGPGEWIRTKPIGEWKKELPNLHKRPVIFLMLAD